MTRRLLALPIAAVAAALCAVALAPSSGEAAARAQTLRFFDKPVSIKLTHADGTVVTREPLPDPKPGDTLEVNSLDFRGDHAHHTGRFTGSGHLRCVFGSSGPPSCESQIALGGSLLVFTGTPGTLTNGTGIYQGAGGRVVSSKPVPGQANASDVVARITLRS